MLAIDRLSERDEVRAQLLGSFLTFARVFYPLKTGREFFISSPPGRESHIYTIARELRDVFNLKTKRLLINVPPGHHKSTILCLWVAWCYANYPDCNFMYVSVGYDLAEKHTAFIKEIMQMREYIDMFDVHIDASSKAKGNFKTTAGGECVALGATGVIVGKNAGLPNLDRMSGGVIMDDMHSPSEVFSDTMRQAVIENYQGTIEQRPRGANVPIIFIGQRLHEEDLPGWFLDGKDGYAWKRVIIPSLDEHLNPLYPEVFPKEMLLVKREVDPYNFAAQHMQMPIPAGGGIFQKDWFVKLDLEPNIISTFITCDTAETDKNYNDATVFSFWGVYKIEVRGVDTGVYGLHWLDCREVRIEPKDLEAEFYDFYFKAMKHRVKPTTVLIEKKSTGVTLSSMLSMMQGVRIIPIDHNAQTGSKAKRFMDCQSYVASRRISLPANALHTELCVNHMSKITANNSHAHDDIADTLELAVRAALIDETLLPPKEDKADILAAFSTQINRLATLRNQAR
jgi:predicted phage terminase large subunit-like protein